jgi:hypothetical protein
MSGLPVLDRFRRALAQAAFRISGTTLPAVSGDTPTLDRIVVDLHDSFVRQLRQPDVDDLTAELERIVSAAERSR